MWFKELTGFIEQNPKNVREKIIIDGDLLISTVNKQKFAYGKLEIPTLKQLKRRSPLIGAYKEKIEVSYIIGDVQELHRQPDNSSALFQAASQFNLLEMVDPNIKPEQGIDRYERDFTQGPACAIACGAGTIYRNYFVETNSQIGQTTDNQIDCLEEISSELNNTKLSMWTMKNGYALFSKNGLIKINEILSQLTEIQRESLKEKLKVGIQWNTEVTISKTKHKVSQIYCSALPVAYSNIKSVYWEQFSRIILEATYEAALYTAMINMETNNSNKLYLTLVGGGAFGNKENWILESLQKAIIKFKNVPLDIRVVCYGQANLNLQRCLNEI